MLIAQFIVKILVETPIWVWFIFSYLIYIGIKALTPQIIYLPRLFIMPIVLTAMKYRTIASSIEPSQVLLIYMIGIVVGIVIGGIVVHKEEVKGTAIKLSVSIQGNYYTIIMMILYFCLKCVFGYYYSNYAELYDQVVLFDTAASSIFLGFFLGRAITYVHRYKNIVRKI